MPPVNESSVLPAQARQAFIAALESWDAPAADTAIAGLVRSAGADEVLELFWRYAPRDFRSIGHKIIFAANAKRTLDCIGWHHAEPVLRSLAYALMSYSGDNPAKRDDVADRPGRSNLALIKEIPENCARGSSIQRPRRTCWPRSGRGSEDDACRKVVDLLKKGIAPQSIWDGLFAGASELLMRRAGIVPLHALTTSNAIRYAYERSAATRPPLAPPAKHSLRRPVPQGDGTGEKKGRSFPSTDRKARSHGAQSCRPGGDRRDLRSSRQGTADRRPEDAGILNTNQEPKALIDAGVLLIFLKGRDSHDYKFSSAVLEDYYHVSPEWRNRFLAGSTYRAARIVRRRQRAGQSHSSGTEGVRVGMNSCSPDSSGSLHSHLLIRRNDNADILKSQMAHHVHDLEDLHVFQLGRAFDHDRGRFAAFSGLILPEFHGQAVHEAI